MQIKRNTLLSFLFFICLWEGYSIWKGERVFFRVWRWYSKTAFCCYKALFLENVGIDNSKSRCRFWTLLFSFCCLSSFDFLETRDGNFVDCFFGVCRILPSVVLIVLLLVFVPLTCLPFVIQVCVVLPLMYEQALKSLESFEQDISLFLHFYRISYWKRFRKVYLPKIFREMYKNLEGILGLCFKVTIAGELLAQEETSVGGEIFTQKMYLNLSTVFAWCFVLLVLHFFMLLLLKRFGVGYESLDRSSL